MKLNLGCGNNKLPGYVNVDQDELFKPDLCFDVTSSDWPIETSVVEEVVLEHVLEHLEGNANYVTFWKELYRVCQHGAIIKIEVPHWKHENFYHDPTHVRAVTPVGIAMLDQKRNFDDMQHGGKESKLGMMWKVDFEMEAVNYGFEHLTGEPMVCYYITKCVKPPRYSK